MEIKIRSKNDNSDQIKHGIVQAYGYGQNYNTQNIIVIVLPEFVTDQISNFQSLSDRVMKSRVETIVLTEYWYAYETRLSVEEILSNLKAKIDKNLSAVMREGIASAVIQRTVQNLSRLLNKHYRDDHIIQEASKELTRDYGLFIKLSSHSSDKQVRSVRSQRNQTVDLMAYILVNQILFYFLYSEKTYHVGQPRKVPGMKTISHPIELESYFEKIRSIDYGPIFDIRIAHRIPYAEEILQEINYLIQCLIPLQIDKLKHDLYGKLFENSLPKDTRKVLASYYTKSPSADLLVNLTIDNYNDTVWDLACGSGTLLMSSYDRKYELFEQERKIYGRDEFKKLHAKFLEQEITGTDIMPFACHLTGLNLSAKGLDVTTEFMRVSCMNVLSIKDIETDNVFIEANSQINEATDGFSRAQRMVDDFIEVPKVQKIVPKTFVQEKVDRVVINPPFTGVRKLPKEYRVEFNESTLSSISGNRNLWGRFLALADMVLKDGGKIGAIIPISFLHGLDTLKLRDHFLENYSIQYIIKPVIGSAFSEDSQFTDIILIAKKVKPEKSQNVKFVCLKEDVSTWSRVDINALSKNIKMELENSDKEYLSYTVKQEELRDNRDNLMKYIFTNNGKFKKKSDTLVSDLEKNVDFVKIKRNDICDGLALRVDNGVDDSVFTRKLGDSRISKARLTFEQNGIDEHGLQYFDKLDGATKSIDNARIAKTLRTLTGIQTMNVSDTHDYILRDKFKAERVANVFIQNRFWLKSKELHFISVFSEEAILPLNMFIMYNSESSYSKVLTLYFNSIFFIVQLLRSAKQSTRGYLEIKQIDLPDLLVPNLKKLDKPKIQKLSGLFDKLQSEYFGPLHSQFSEPSSARLELDSMVAATFEIKTNLKDLKEMYSLVALHISSLP